jgi:Ca2+-binding RTX toxin-like protein
MAGDPEPLILTGTSGNDALSSGDEMAILRGLAGDDILFGGGGDDRLEGGDHFDQLDGGTGSDVLHGGAGDDVFFDDDPNGGAGNDQMFGGDGWDSMHINRRGLSAPTQVLMDGGGGPDVITFSPHDWRDDATLIGGDGDDEISAFWGRSLTIDAGTGNDRVGLNFLGATTTVTLGAGRDFLALFAYDGAAPAGGSITVTDFEAGDQGDRLELLTYLVQRLPQWDPETNPFATQNLRLVQLGADTLLQLDSDGSGTGAGFTTLLTLQNVTASSLTVYNLGGYAGDGTAPALTRITGTAGLDQLWGTGGMDIIQGLGSQDEIFGGAGDDWIEGGDGKDLLYGQFGDDSVFGEAGVDNLVDQEGGDDQLFGGDDTDYVVVLRKDAMALSNVLLDGGEGDDFLDFNALHRTDGATLIGGNGNDSLRLTGNGEMSADGGAGDDHFAINYSNGLFRLTLGDGADHVSIGADFGFGAGLAVVIDDFSAASDRIDLANYLSNRLYGWNGSANPFAGGFVRLAQSGADALLQVDRDAGPGSNVFETLITFRDLDATSLTAFNLGATPGPVEGAAVNGSAGDDYIAGTSAGETISGFAGNDVLIGGGGSDYLVGGIGDDVLTGNAGTPSTLQGGAGDDWYYIHGAGDSIVEFAGEGSDRIVTGAGYTLSSGQSIETITASDQAGTAAIDLTGNALGQVMFGNAGANVLTGGGGTDYLLGLAGGDTLVGNADAASTLQGGAGDDWYYVFQTGDSLVEFAGEGSDRILTSVSYTLSAGQEIETLTAATPTGSAAIDLIGNGLAQFIQGTNGANILSGDGGADQLSGLGGSDILLGGDGDDFLNGGAASDVLNGGAGADIFVFADAPGAGNIDAIQDFASGSDRIALDHHVFTGLSNGVLPANAFVVGAAAQDADDRILYDSATGALWFDADGNGAGAAVQFATLSGHPPIAAGDFAVI